MARRVTRSMVPKETVAFIQKVNTQPSDHKKPTSTKQVNKTSKTAVQVKANPVSKKYTEITDTKGKRKSAVSVEQEGDINELPHNLGNAPPPIVKDDIDRPQSAIKRNSGHPIDQRPVTFNDDNTKLATNLSNTNGKAKKGRTKGSLYGLTPGVSPFPHFVHPTPEECEEVNRLLSTIHGEIAAPATIPQPSLTVTGCGEVPSVLDALIRTLLSGATTGANSARAFQGLVQKFGILEDGIGKGSVNWDAVRCAPIDDVFQALKSGGLAVMKSRYIKDILNMVHEENMQRRDALLKAETVGTVGPAGVENESDAFKQNEISCANENVLSLDYIHALDNDQAMLELVKYPGIGPKTAACVILFCLQRPCFAVDTHIFRICKWLGWVPSEKVNEVTAFSHLEVRIPDHLKYSLHQLLIRHGKTCPRCRAITGEGSEGWDEGCVIDHLVTRTGKRKGGADTASSKTKKTPAKSKRKKEDESTEDEDNGDDDDIMFSDG